MLTTEQIARIRRHLGRFETEFTDDDLQNYYQDAKATYPDSVLENAVVYLALVQIQYDALLETDYQQNESRDSRAVVYDRIASLVDMWRARAKISKFSVAAVSTFNLGIDTPDDVTQGD